MPAELERAVKSLHTEYEKLSTGQISDTDFWHFNLQDTLVLLIDNDDTYGLTAGEIERLRKFHSIFPVTIRKLITTSGSAL